MDTPFPLSALLLVAGRGERLRPLTDTTPKPLVTDGHGTPLLGKWLARLAAARIQQVVLNPCWLGEAIEAFVGNGSRWGVTVAYSRETPPGLETAGGIRTALPLLTTDPFLVVNGDVDLAPEALLSAFLARGFAALAAHPQRLAYLLLVPNPPDHAAGDFTLCPDQTLLPYPDPGAGTPCTFAGVALYRAALVAALPAGTRAPLAPLLRSAIAQGAAAGELWRGCWWDVGTPERLARWRAATAATEPPPAALCSGALRPTAAVIPDAPCPAGLATRSPADAPATALPVAAALLCASSASASDVLPPPFLESQR